MQPYNKNISSQINIYFTKLPKEFSQSIKKQLQQQLQQLQSSKRRADHVIGRELLKKVIEANTGIDKRKIVFSENEYGKPFINIEDKSIQFNLSHTKDIIIASFSNDIEVGIDIEERNRDFFDIMPEVFTNKEIEMVNQGTHINDRLDNFYTLWTRKEAITKAMGLGLNYNFKNIEFESLELNKLNMLLEWWYYTFPLGSRYIVSVARKGKFDIPFIHEVSLDALF